MITRARASALLFGAAALSSIRFPGLAQSNAALDILAPLPVKAALDQIVPLFKQTSGRAAVVEYVGLAMVDQVQAGKPFDIAIGSIAAMDVLVKAGFVLPDSQTPFGTTIFSLAYRNGTTRPDISTPDALKAVLLNAKTISYSDPAAGGPSSVYFAGVIQRLGISDAVQHKAVLTKAGEGAFPVGDGRAEIGIAQTSEIALVPGVDGVPLAPSDPKAKAGFAAAVAAKSPSPDAARAFVRFILSPDATAIRKAKGFVVE